MRLDAYRVHPTTQLVGIQFLILAKCQLNLVVDHASPNSKMEVRLNVIQINLKNIYPKFCE